MSLVSPFLGQGVLGFGASQFIELFAQRFGRPFVTGAHFFEHLLQHISAGIGGHPFTQTRSAFARGGGGQCATGQGV